MDAALRDNLSMALGDGLDKQVIAGPEGLLTGAKLANHNVDAVTTFDLYLAGLAYSRVDGTYASTAGDLRILVRIRSLRPCRTGLPECKRGSLGA